MLEYTAPASRRSPPPAPGQQATNPARPAKQKIPNQPNLAAPFLHQHRAQHPAPATASPPGNPTQPDPPSRCTKRTQFPHPATTQSPPPPPLTQKPQPSPNPRKSKYQTDPIPKNQSKSTSYGHLPRTASRISPGLRQSKSNCGAELEETCGFSWPAELLIPQSPRARQAP